jgi:hypothetical protein
MAMILAGFSTSDIADKIVRQQVRRRLALMGGADNNQREVDFDDVDNTPSCYEYKVLWYLHTVLTYQSHVTPIVTHHGYL